MNPWQQLLLVWAVAVLAQACGWLWQRKHTNAGIVDVVWSFGVGGAAVLAAATGSGAMLPRVLLAVLGGVWGLRLGLHLWHRVRGEPEDVATRSCACAGATTSASGSRCSSSRRC